MNKRVEEIQDEIVKRVYKIFDQLEQRISTLEKVNAVTKEHGSLTESQYDDSTYTLNERNT